MNVFEEHEIDLETDFSWSVPELDISEVTSTPHDLLSPAKGLLLGIVIGLGSWTIVGVFVYLLLIR
jgi:hypothetical protein